MSELVERWPRPRALKVREVLDRIQVCGCGTNAQWECLLELLCEAETHTKEGFYRDKWFEWGAKVLDKWDLLEHGTGAGFMWLTDDGKLILEFLREFGTESHYYPDGSGHPFWTVEFSWSEKEDPADTYSEWASGARTPSDSEHGDRIVEAPKEKEN